MKTPVLSVCLLNSTVYLKIVGRAVFTSSVQFKTLIQELNDRGYADFVIDLKECIIMDSTFLGVLAGTASRLGRTPASRKKPAIKLIGTNERVTDLLENLGVTNLFELCDGSALAENGIQTLPAKVPNPSREEISRTCLEAHEMLMELNPENVAKLKDVTAFLAQDLKKLENRQTSSSSSS